MNKSRSMLALFALALLAVGSIRAAESNDKDIIEKQKPSYPLKTCVVTGEKLDGEMGPAIDYVYKGRLIRFCCKGCIKKFEKDPEPYLKKLDEAAKASQSSSSKASGTAATNQSSHDMSGMGGMGGHSGGAHDCCK